MRVQFEVEQTLSTKGQALVIARQIGHGDFILGQSQRLGGLPIHAVVTAPRALDASGQPRLDIFAFRLLHEADLSRLSKGDRVQLEDGDVR
jgi:hypothetical protein